MTCPGTSRPQGLAGSVPVSGQDGDAAALNRVALGTQSVSVWKDARELGKAAGEAALALAGGTAMPSASGAIVFVSPGGNSLNSILLVPIPALGQFASGTQRWRQRRSSQGSNADVSLLREDAMRAVSAFAVFGLVVAASGSFDAECVEEPQPTSVQEIEDFQQCGVLQ